MMLTIIRVCCRCVVHPGWPELSFVVEGGRAIREGGFIVSDDSQQNVGLDEVCDMRPRKKALQSGIGVRSSWWWWKRRTRRTGRVGGEATCADNAEAGEAGEPS